ncbi:MAG: hypothetical protein HKP48_00335 [Winogradskyella sp.]|uniref:hypothetical protein n=1 Tax=Winogradskyella sp. TaxID=1883156 RepID=UPI0017E8025E|nr:hypothetical protein [Winogradskyella sp.]NNK21763.1 hypothetical protein [Winogradskyella sp.]
MKKIFLFVIGFLIISSISCNDDNLDFQDDDSGFQVEIPDFNFQQTVVFENSLLSYNIYQGNPSNLLPSDDFLLLELSSILFTDYAYKQRLVKVPEGTQMTRLNDNSIDFPDGTILAKTFFYYNDERDTSLGKRIIETRLLIKESNLWNVATYIWNDAQTDATLELNGMDTQVSWTNSNGNNISTLYHIPDRNECITCHQSNSTLIPLGTKLRNLNRVVERNGASINQINHLQSVGVLNGFQVNEISQIVDYNSLNFSLEERGRAYLEMNCAHCHNPSAWEESAEQDLDFRYETPLNQTGLLDEQDEIINLVSEGEMPLIGTSILDQEGIDLIIQYIESL